MKTFTQSIKSLFFVLSLIATGIELNAMNRFTPKESKEDLRKELLRAEREWFTHHKQEKNAQIIQAALRGYAQRTVTPVYTPPTCVITSEFENEEMASVVPILEQQDNNCITIQTACRGFLERQNCKTMQLRAREAQWKELNPESLGDSFNTLTTTQYLKKNYDFIDIRQEVEKALILLKKEQESAQNDIELSLLNEWVTTLQYYGQNSLDYIAAHRYIKNAFEENWEVVPTKNQKTSLDPILLVSLHGTFANPDEAGKNKKSKNSIAITDYAQWLAESHGNDVDLLMFQWTAANSESSREESGKKLADVILTYMKKHNITQPGTIKLFSVTHSWGGAVMQYAAKEVFAKTGIEFDLGIQTACPVPHVERTSGEHFHFKHLLQFYSNADLTQILGSNSTLSQLGGRKMPLLIDNDHRVWNIRILDDGEELNHINIKWKTMQQAPQLITTILKQYNNQFDLDANILPEEKTNSYRLETRILVGTRNVGEIPLSSQQEYFDICNKKVFEEIYKYPMKDKSHFFIKVLKLCTKTPIYGVIQSTVGNDPWIINNDNETIVESPKKDIPSSPDSSQGGCIIS